MTWSGNFMIDGDDGSDCESPKHNPNTCRLCIEELNELNKPRCKNCDSYLNEDEECEYCYVENINN